MNRPVRRPLVMAACVLFVRHVTFGAEPDTFSPLVSFQYLNAIDDSSETSPIVSPLISFQYLNALDESQGVSPIIGPLVSYQYFDWPGDENLPSNESPPVSYYQDGPPLILAQPQAQLRKIGDTAMFTVDVLGAVPLTYQWRVRDALIPGANSSSLTINDLLPSYSGPYSVVITNAYGEATSKQANLTVYLGAPPTFPGLPDQTETKGALSEAQKTKRGNPPVSTQLKWFNVETNNYGIAPATLPPSTVIVLTHGFQSDPYGTTEEPGWPLRMARAFGRKYGSRVNVFAWDWHNDAYMSLDPGIVATRTVPQGYALGSALMDTLGDSFEKNIHFLGHSLGTAVNCAAVNYVHGTTRPGDDGRPTSQKYAPFRTHVTLFDEASIVGVPQGLRIIGDAWLGLFDDEAVAEGSEIINNFGLVVIPEKWGWIDNYLSDVGFLHAEAVNVMLWRENYSLPSHFLDPHSYAYKWYHDTISAPMEISVGHRWSFENSNSLFLGPIAPSYYRQSFDLSEPDLKLVKIPSLEAKALSLGHMLAFPSLKAAQGLDAAGKYIQQEGTSALEKISAKTTAAGAAYLDGIEYAGDMVANFVEDITHAMGSPVYVGVPDDNAGYILSPNGIGITVPQARWDMSFSIQSGTPEQQKLKIPIKARGKPNNSGDPIYTIVPVHVPNEAIGMTFQFRINQGSAGEFMTLGIGEENIFTIEAKYVASGQWNRTPVLETSGFRNQDVRLVFAVIGQKGSPTATLGVRRIQFYTPPAPTLELSHLSAQPRLVWPLSALDWTLESTDDLSSPSSWLPVPGEPSESNYEHTVILNSADWRRFFRLTK